MVACSVDLSATRTFLTRFVRAISCVVALITEDGMFGTQFAEEIIEIEGAGAAALDALGLCSLEGVQKHPHLF
jgi:hypothetical protein